LLRNHEIEIVERQQEGPHGSPAASDSATDRAREAKNQEEKKQTKISKTTTGLRAEWAGYSLYEEDIRSIPYQPSQTARLIPKEQVTQ
jgi:hypothetical protein